MKLTDYVVEFLQKKGIRDFFGYQGTMIAHLVPAIMSRELLLRPAVMLRRKEPAAVHMPQAVPELPICSPAWLMHILIRFR